MLALDEEQGAPVFAQPLSTDRGCGLSGDGEVPRLLGRIEATLSQMHESLRKVIEGQDAAKAQLEIHNDRIEFLEREQGSRKDWNRSAVRTLSVVGLTLLIPTIGWLGNVFDWFHGVNQVVYPKDKS